MKTNIFYTAILTVGFTSVYSQPITITEADMPHVGTTVIYMEYNDQEIDPGASGANMTWDFSSLSSFTGGDIDTVSYVTPVSTPYTGYFPNATITQQKNNSEYIFYIVNISYFSDIGGYSNIFYPAGQFSFYPNPLKILTLPSTYLSTHNITASYYTTPVKGQICDSIKDVGTISGNGNIDGWGTIITPWGTYSCLRQVLNLNFTNTSYCLDSTGTWTEQNPSSPLFFAYVWWANGIEFPILSIYKQSLFSGPVTRQIRCLISSTAGIDESAAKKFLKTVPNPATNEINFFITSANSSKLEIYDSVGKRITSLYISQGKASMNSAELTKGLLFFKVFSENGETLGQGKFIIE